MTENNEPKNHVVPMPNFILDQVSKGVDTFCIAFNSITANMGDYIEFHGKTKTTEGMSLIIPIIRFKVIKVYSTSHGCKVAIQRVHPWETELQKIKKNMTMKVTSYRGIQDD